MHRTRIEYGHWAWNPVIGCEHGCPYCWARRQAERGIGVYGTWAKGDRFTPRLLAERLPEPKAAKASSRILVSFMGDLFGAWVPREWIEAVLQVIRETPRHRYLLLTKNPARYAEFDLPDNCWAGTTVTGDGDQERILQLWGAAHHAHRWLSWEPALGPLELEPALLAMEWVVIGGLTGRRTSSPEAVWTENVVGFCEDEGIPVFTKANIGSGWPGEPLRQYPEGLVVDSHA